LICAGENEGDDLHVEQSVDWSAVDMGEDVTLTETSFERHTLLVY